MYKLKKVALTGATSTLGTAIIRECIANEIQVVAFVSRDSKNEKRIPESPFVKKIYCALEEMKTVDVSGVEAEVFFHLAWASTNRAVRNNLTPQVDNIRFSLDSVYLAEQLGCSTYVGAGSQAEYGRTNEKLAENTYLKPETAYGMAKLCAGQMTRLECRSRGMKHIWPRILSTYGPYTQDTTIINYTIKCLLHGERPSLSGCEQIWDFLYVDDAAKALLLLAEKGSDGEIYNVASGSVATLKEYVEIIKNIINPDAEIGYGDLPYDNGSVMYLEGDITKLKKETGFAPMISFEEGIAKTIEWAKNYYKRNDDEKNKYTNSMLQ